MSQETQLWIGDRWVTADKSEPLLNPHTGEVIAQVGYASIEQAKSAIKIAAQAFESFKQSPAHERAEVLYRVAEILNRRKEEAAKIIAMEAAKPIRAARAEIDRTVQTYQFAGEAAKNVRGETIPMDAAPRGENHLAFVRHRPLGVVSAITPFNFPFNLVAHKVGPAIAAGNTIVLKPAEQTPLSALFLADIFKDAGLPTGVLNIIPGYGHELGEVLSTHPLVSFVTFTGSPRVGKLIRAQAGIRKVTLELGSNSPLLIDRGFSDEEMGRIAQETAAGAFGYNGQVCISIQRIYVHEDVSGRFLERLVDATKQLVIGHPLDESTDITALINTGAASRVKQWIDNATAQGAVTHCGGTREGNVIEPTVLSRVPLDAELNCEEVFGPVVIVQPYSTWDEAISMANHSKYGLNAGVFTKDVERALEAADRLEAGGVLINQIPTFRIDQMPYGGVKDSGSGREGVKYAMEEMMEPKVVGFRSKVY